MAQPKNVILLVTDSWQRSYTGCYGNQWIKTPNIDRLAREGIIFDNAFSEGLPTIPVRRTLATGRYCSPFVGWSNLTHNEITISDVCNRSSVHTALIADTQPLQGEKYSYSRSYDFVRFFRGQEGDLFYQNDPLLHLDPDEYHKPIYEPGTTNEIDISRLTLMELGQLLPHRQYWKSDEDQHSARTCKAAANYIDNVADRNKPFFLWVDSFDPHEPWDPPSVYDRDLKCPYDPDYKDKDIILPVPGPVENSYNEEELHHIRMLYAEKITNTDKWIGVLIDRLKEKGLYDNTMIVWLSDHGEPLGNGEDGHGIMRKCRPWPYDELVHVPLVIRHPDIEPRRVSALVQNTDIAPTILDYLNVGAPEEIEQMHGKSLIPLMQGDTNNIRNFIVANFHNMSWSIYTENWSFIHWLHGGNAMHNENAMISFYKDNLMGQYPNMDKFRPGVWDYKLGEDPIWTCTPGSKAKTPDIDELYDRRKDPHQLQNLIHEDPKTANDLFVQLRDFMISLKTGTY